MGPFPHDAPAATISTDNPMGTDGFEFVEYAHPKPEALHALFKLMGYVPVARHRTKKITVYRQGDINYLVNEQPGTHGFAFVAAHGPCAPSMAFRVADASQAYQRALSLGAEPVDLPAAHKTLDVPAIKGIGGSLLYFVDRYGAKALPTTPSSSGSAPKIHGRKAPGYIISITSPTTFIAAAWMSGPASTKNYSTSGRFASSISRAVLPDCSRGP
jgi:4-hydroxyphenylpyruvate dioxygenase-like putative hemolysin